MNGFTSISARLLLMAFAGVAMLRTTAHSTSVDERFKVIVNMVIQNVKHTENPVEKREMLGTFLKQMDQGLGRANALLPSKDGAALNIWQMKMKADLAALNGNGVAKIPDSDLNRFAGYVQQDVEQAERGFYISVVGLLVVLLILLLVLR